MRLKLEDAANVMKILKRNEIHVAIELVISGEQILERLMFIVARIAVSRAIAVLERDSRCTPGVREGVTSLGNKHPSFVVQTRGVGTQAQITKVPQLTGGLEEVIPVTKFARLGQIGRASCR